MGSYIEDPYEYPPQFLLLPQLALALTDDYMVHRSAVFVVQVLAFLTLALIVAGWVGGPRGQLAAFLLPVMMGSLPLMFNFQFGQFHLAAIALAMAGMLCIKRNRIWLGGALLAAAIVTKVFPGLLVVYLLVRRRWSAVATTAGFSILISGLALAILGTAPFVAFFEYHLPRLATGEAFAFFTKVDLELATNYGVYGIPFKLQRLGVPGMSEDLAAGLAWVYGLVVVGVTVMAARRPRAPTHEPLVWLGLLTLASLRSPLAPSVYVSAPAIWLLTLLAWDTRGKAARIVLLLLAWVSMGGLPPMPTPEGTIILWMSGQVAILALGFWSVWRRYEAADARPQHVPHG